MLERTAGCLEQGSLRRLLPTSKKQLNGRRLLRTTSSRSSVIEADDLPLCQRLTQGSDHVDDSHEKPVHALLNNSSGLFLDFLYPSGAISILRMCSAWHGRDWQSRLTRPRHNRPGQRHYSSSTFEEASVSALSPEELPFGDGLSGPESVSTSSGTSELRGLLQGDTGDAEQAWQLFQALPAAHSEEFQPLVLQYLSTCSRGIDAQRAINLFERQRGLPTSEGYLAALRSYTALGDFPKALDLRDKLLRRFDNTDGSSILLSRALALSQWECLPDIWWPHQRYRRQARRDIGSRANDPIWEAVDKLPEMQKQALKLAAWVEAELGEVAAMSEKSKDFTMRSSGLVGMSQIILLRAMSPKIANFSSKNFLKILAVLQRWGVDSDQQYEEIISQFIDAERWKLAIHCYHELRARPSNKITVDLLDRLLPIFCSNDNVAGIKFVLDDWFRIYGRPSRAAYRLCMRNFAARGDADTVHSLWTQYTSPEVNQASGHHRVNADDVGILMHVHARRAELPEVIKIFDEMETKYSVKPGVKNWNILINAYGKAHDIEGALSRFEEMMSSKTRVQPDDYTIGTLMSMCVNRGDLSQAMELYQKAETLGIERSAAMVDSIVLGHIQEGRLSQAEKICEDAVQMKPKGSFITMWNFLLTASAMQRDLSNTNRILRRMRELEIEYNGATYAALLQALAMVKQPDRAYSILTKVLPEAGIPITQFHYAIVMGGYLATKQFNRVFELNEAMKQHNIDASISTKLFSVKAAAQLDQQYKTIAGKAEDTRLIAADKAFYDAITNLNAQDAVVSGKKGFGRQPADMLASSAYFSFMIFVYGQHNAVERVKHLYESYQSKIPESKRATPPAKILSAIMVAYFKEGNYDGVQQCWDLAYSQAVLRGKSLSSDSETTILPIHRLALASPLSTLILCYSRQSKLQALSHTIAKLQDTGFELDNANWNSYIQSLARGSQYKAAFALCEAKLMPGWTGWARLRRKTPQRNRLDISVRNKKKDRTYLRPLYHTMLYLAKGLAELEESVKISRTAQFALKDLAKRCPQTLRALQTMERTGGRLERTIMGASQP